MIAADNGPAYGGGFGVALACDIRLASESARFCTQFIKLGLVTRLSDDSSLLDDALAVAENLCG